MKSSWLFIYPLPLFSLQIQTRLLFFHKMLASSLINFLETDIEWEKMKIGGTAEMFFWHLPTQRDINRKVKRFQWRRAPKAIHCAPQIQRVSLDLWNNCGRIKFSENENKSHWFTKLLSREVFKENSRRLATRLKLLGEASKRRDFIQLS